MHEKTAALLIRDPCAIDIHWSLVAQLHQSGYRFAVFLIGIDPRQFSAADRNHLKRLREWNIDLFTDGPDGGFCHGVGRVDCREIAGHLDRAELVIPL